MMNLPRDILLEFVRTHVDDPAEALELQQALRSLLLEAQNFAPGEQVSKAHEAAIRSFERRWRLEEREFDRIKDLVLEVMTRAERVTTLAQLHSKSLLAEPNALPLQRPTIRVDHEQATG